MITIITIIADAYSPTFNPILLYLGTLLLDDAIITNILNTFKK
jgi:hypothetical protein